MVLLMCFWSFNFNPSPRGTTSCNLVPQTAMCNQLRVVKSFQQVLSIAKSFCRELNAKWGLLVSPGDASCMAELAMQWMSTSALKRAYRAGWVQPHGESQTSTFWRMDANHLSLALKGMPYVKYDELNPPFIFMCL